MNVFLTDLWEQNEDKNLDMFADKLLNKMKRDEFSVALKDGYIMSVHRCFIINDNFLKRSEAKEFIKKYCQKD